LTTSSPYARITQSRHTRNADTSTCCYHTTTTNYSTTTTTNYSTTTTTYYSTTTTTTTTTTATNSHTNITNTTTTLTPPHGMARQWLNDIVTRRPNKWYFNGRPMTHQMQSPSTFHGHIIQTYDVAPKWPILHVRRKAFGGQFTIIREANMFQFHGIATKHVFHVQIDNEVSPSRHHIPMATKPAYQAHDHGRVTIDGGVMVTWNAANG
jgi:hypothetical protein